MRGNRPARLNRGLLALLGLLLLAAGAAILVIRQGRVATVKPGAAVLPDPNVPPTWVFYTIAAVAIVLGLLGLRWLAAQLAVRPRVRTWQLEPHVKHGRTELTTGVAVAPFTEEVTAYPGVRAVRATLSGSQRDPTLAVVINATLDADPTAIRAQLATEGLPRLRQALDLAGLPVTVEFRVPASARGAR
jgi:hypothetical protein